MNTLHEHTGSDVSDSDEHQHECCARDGAYGEQLRSGIPLYMTCLVKQSEFTFEERAQVSNPEEVVGVLHEYYGRKDREEVLVMLLDAANTVIGIALLSIGSLTASIIDPRQVFKAAILANAASIILCHNHPSGNLKPSREDIRITRKITRAGRLLDIPLRDHLIIANGAFTSLARHGVIDVDD
jgi:DNA repair protein RadC